MHAMRLSKAAPLTHRRIAQRRGGLRLQLGQSLLEVALLTPFLLLLSVAAIDMGRYAYIGILVGNAARAGAAYGAAAPGDSTGTVNAACNDFLSNLGSNPAPTCDGSSSTTNNHLEVTSAISCGCDTGGAVSIYTGGACNNVDTSSTGPIATCVGGGGHWAAMVTVTASGTFNALFSWPGIPSSMTINRTATVRVNP